MPVFLFLVTVLSRLPFTSKYLYHMDSGHFALALDKYDLTLHQPHPPGYFLYIMLGRLVRFFVNDANTALVLLSIAFSGLAVVTIYLLGREVFNEKSGILAAFLMLTSPNFWFHGEVALSYSADAFFSALIGLCCWRALKGNSRYVWISALALGLSSGFRQNTGVFLLPLWLFSIRKESFRSIVTGIALFGITGSAWFLPMVTMAGGLESYQEAFRELWLFHTGHNSVFEKGLSHLRANLETLFIFFFYSLGVLLPLMVLALYGLVRNRALSLLKNSTTLFLVCWTLPPLLFHLLIFISGNPGYVLIMLPPLIISAAASLAYLDTCMPMLAKNRAGSMLVTAIIAANAAIFFYTSLPVSNNEIRTHDTNLQSLLKELETSNAGNTLLFVDPNSSYSYRHLMYYLPDYTVYQVDVRTSSTGRTRLQFGGSRGQSFLTDKIRIPDRIRYFTAIVLEASETPRSISPGITVTDIATDIRVATGPIGKALCLYPELKPYWKPVISPAQEQPQNNRIKEQEPRVKENRSP
jgi:hypothetical protein